MKIKHVILAVAALGLAAASYAQSAPAGAYVEPDGSWYERNGYALPATAGETESDGSKAKDYATNSEATNATLASMPNAPQGVIRAHNNGWGDYHRVYPVHNPHPPEEKN